MIPTWLNGLKAVAQAIAGALPALLVVIFAGLLALLGLACEPDRRSYALAYADRFVDLAAVLVGLQRSDVPSRPDAEDPKQMVNKAMPKRTRRKSR